MARGYRPANLDRGRSGTWEGARPTGRACRGTVTSRVHTYVPPPRVTELVATVTESQGPCGDIVRTDDKQGLRILYRYRLGHAFTMYH